MSTQASSNAIRRTGHIPYYAQLAAILREQIATDVYGPGDLLPAESEICSMYGLSRTVVRQALDDLVAEGLVTKQKGRGTFVAEPKIADLIVHELRGFSDEMALRGHTVGTEILEFQIIEPPKRAKTELNLAPGEQVVHLERIRSINGEPIVKVHTFLPAGRFAALLDEPLDDKGLYQTLFGRFGIIAGSGRRRIEAVVASRDLADALGVELGGPLLEFTAVTHDSDGVPFEFFRAWYRGDRASFEVLV